LAVANVNDEKPKEIGGRYGRLLKDIPPGLNYSFYTEEMGHPAPQFAWRSKFSDLLYKADPYMPVRTIKAQGGQYTGPFHWENRPFSIGELKRLQTFPDAYTLLGSRVVKIEQIGNSVPPQLARILAIAVLEQVFDLQLPFSIDYLKPQEELMFRQRKARLTSFYRKRAKEAITRLYGTNSDSNALNNADFATTILPNQASEIHTSHDAYLGNNFSWIVKENDEVDYSWNIKYTIYETDQTLRFLIGNQAETRNRIAQIHIEVIPTNKWILSVKSVHLVIQEPSLWHLTAGWKAFEHYLAKKKIKADLVQLNGYYQYAPKISMVVREWKSSHLSPHDFSYFTAVREILEGRGTRQILSLEDLSDVWGISQGETIKALVKLKEVGYEVRSEFTNNQIPQGHVLIPYAFPTFNPNSVQLRKLLFPEGFLQRLLSSEESAMKNQGLWSSDTVGFLGLRESPCVG
jgi:DNA (cytosine-5)-methyltransferase 1